MVPYPKKWREVLFKGSFQHTLDAKGRIIIPAKLKKYISEDADDTLIMLPGANKCIEVYPKDIWQRKEAQLAALDIDNEESLYLIRAQMNRAHEDKMDQQSRILVPAFLKRLADIQTDVLVVGTLERIEFWNPAEYEEYFKSITEPLSSLKARLLARKNEIGS
jgi:MraZ protein